MENLIFFQDVREGCNTLFTIQANKKFYHPAHSNIGVENSIICSDPRGIKENSYYTTDYKLNLLENKKQKINKHKYNIRYLCISTEEKEIIEEDMKYRIRVVDVEDTLNVLFLSAFISKEPDSEVGDTIQNSNYLVINNRKKPKTNMAYQIDVLVTIKRIEEKQIILHGKKYIEFIYYVSEYIKPKKLKDVQLKINL